MRRRSSKNSGKTTDVVDVLTPEELASLDEMERGIYEDIRDEILEEEGADWMIKNRETSRLQLFQIFGPRIKV